MEIKNKPEKPKGKLGILTPGMGAVSTTFIAGVESIRRGLAKPIGSLSSEPCSGRPHTITLSPSSETAVTVIRASGMYGNLHRG